MSSMNGFKEAAEKKHTNSYYLSNETLFDRILSIVENSKTTTTVNRVVNADKELLDYVNNAVPLLSEHTLSTKLNWILHDIHDFPRCRYCNCILPKIDVPIFKTYSKWCSLAHKNKDPEFKKHCGDMLEKRYGKGVRSNF